MKMREKVLAPALLFVVALMAGGCPLAAIIVTVGPTGVTLELNGQIQLAAVSSSPGGAVFTWSSSNPGVCSVTQGGLVTGEAVGAATITATDTVSGVAGTATVTVVEPLISVTPASATIEIDNGMQLDAFSTSTLGSSFTWSSSAAGIASVSPNGAVRGITVGAAVITATDTTTNATGSAAITVIEPLVDKDYVGSWVCAGCHPEIYDDFKMSGHPYKLSKVEGGQPPTFPFSEVPNTPAGFDWTDMTYLIGGYGWKARFIDGDGYILTDFKAKGIPGSQLTQWNLATEEFVSYSPQVLGKKPYTCGACHTTGWVATGAEGPHQDNLPGMHGVFSEPGVHCEACHGPGRDHMLSQEASDITVDTSAELCGECHFRDSQHRIEVSKGFIRHHEQYDELINGGHGGELTCLDCHDPHLSTLYSKSGIISECTDCHDDITVESEGMAGLDCIDCHMPYASKSAVATGSGVHRQGDVATHIFSINTDPVLAEEGMFYQEGGKTFAYGALTVDFVCMGCHNGTSAFVIDHPEIASFFAKRIHPDVK